MPRNWTLEHADRLAGTMVYAPPPHVPALPSALHTFFAQTRSRVGRIPTRRCRRPAPPCGARRPPVPRRAPQTARRTVPARLAWRKRVSDATPANVRAGQHRHVPCAVARACVSRLRLTPASRACCARRARVARSMHAPRVARRPDAERHPAVQNAKSSKVVPFFHVFTRLTSSGPPPPRYHFGTRQMLRALRSSAAEKCFSSAGGRRRTLRNRLEDGSR